MVRIRKNNNLFNRSNSTKLAILAIGIVGAVIVLLAHGRVNSKDYYEVDMGMSFSQGDFNLAKRQSFNFFDDISSANWKRMRQIASKHVNHKKPKDPLNTLTLDSPDSRFYLENYEPNFSCLLEQRVGGNGNGDGPKWVCDPHRLIRISKERKRLNPNVPGCLVYSVGSRGDFNFEVALQKLLGPGVCEVHIFDMGDHGGRMPKGLDLHYHQWGLAKQEKGLAGKKPKPGKEFYSIEETMKLLGHENMPAIDVFKIDCERCEFETYNEWFAPQIPDLRQILVEVHGAPKDHVIDFFDGFQKEGYVTFHKEPNIHPSSQGRFVEYAFLKLEKEFFV
jgi:hypothetical protein